MHTSSMRRMKWFVDNYASKIDSDHLKVLDVGSFNVNGTYKILFDENRYSYTGLDIEAGRNVDIVMNHPYNWDAIETDSFDIVISGQAFEHTEFFWLTMTEIARVLRKGGILCLIAPHGFGEHRFPVDCYRFFTDGMVSLAKYVSFELIHAHTNCAPSLNDIEWYSETMADSMLIARKPYSGKTQHPDMKTYQCHPENHKDLRGGLLPYVRKTRRERLLDRVLRVLPWRKD